jgi:TolB-like protein/predicted metal-dependent HD superfamily phosphohydrolase/Tfp pilus assembly protein PilF
MPSIVSGYEYDIFISYRHKDNRSVSGATQLGFGNQQAGWVTDFVADLGKELESTFKEKISIYFDSSLHDGLLETHDVDKSLEGKLKSLIFIPILSQIYCDPRCFAWQNEFCAFNKSAKEEPLGRDIKLRSGNVASRILPIVIHQLDQEDQNLIETELDSKLRFIDFNFQAPGVNRPLRADDSRQENNSNLFYRDQINKVANAIKEIITAIKNPGRGADILWDSMNGDKEEAETTVASTKESQSTPQNSVAVLPFVSLSHDASQEYFADGIAENILMELAALPKLRVISRTSVMKYKKTTKSAPEIATELGVKFILEGSAQAHNNKVRINVQLIDALREQHIWSKVFVESLDDIFEIQGKVAEVVSKELNASIGNTEKVKEVPTKNREAYDLFLKGRHAFNQWSVEGYRAATDYFQQAIAKDPEFKQAYSYLASSYSARMSWNGDLAPHEAQKNIEKYLQEVWKRGPSDNDYLTKAFVELFLKKDFPSSEKFLLQALELSPNNSDVLYMYSYLLSMMGRFEEALNMVSKAKTLDPLSVSYFNYQVVAQHLMGRNEVALETLLEAINLYPAVVRLYDFLGRINLAMGRFEDAANAILSGLATSKIRPPSMVAYLASAYAGLKQLDKAKELFNELVNRSKLNEKGVNIYLVYICNFLGDRVGALQWFAKAKSTNDVDLIWWNVDPLIKDLREYLKNQTATTPDFAAAEKHILDLLKKEMPARQYHNLDHVQDVLDSALKIGEDEKLNEEEIKLLRVAALFHDSGFIYSPKNHEERGAELAREILPVYGFTSDQMEIICNMIMATRIPQSPLTKLEKVLCDADLDYLGRKDFYEIGGRLLEELKEEGVVETEREWNLVQKTFLESHRYHTRFSKENREAKKREHIQEILAKFKR